MYTSINIRRVYFAVSATMIKSPKTTTIVKETGAVSSSKRRKTVFLVSIGEHCNTTTVNKIMGEFSVVKTKQPQCG